MNYQGNNTNNISSTLGQGAQSVSDTLGQGAQSVSSTLGQGAQSVSSTLGQGAQSVLDTFKEGAQSASNTLSQGTQSVGESINGMTESVQSSLGEFSSKSFVDASSEFLQSNSLIAKFAFIILILIAFMFLLNLGIIMLGYFSKPSSSPFIVSGTINGTNGMVIAQDPKNKSAVTILRSNNENSGIEFTWAVWLYIDDINNSNQNKKYQNIFNKGDGNYDANGIALVNNAPGLYLDNQTNSLHIVMNTVATTNPSETLDITNIPLKKWFHCVIRMKNKIMDVYMNGIVSGRLVMKDVPKQNYNDINVCQNGGFSGSLSDLRYYDRALSIFEINNTLLWGRNTSASTSAASSDATGFPYYLSNIWYSSKY